MDRNRKLRIAITDNLKGLAAKLLIPAGYDGRQAILVLGISGKGESRGLGLAESYRAPEVMIEIDSLTEGIIEELPMLAEPEVGYILRKYIGELYVTLEGETKRWANRIDSVSRAALGDPYHQPGVVGYTAEDYYYEAIDMVIILGVLEKLMKERFMRNPAEGIKGDKSAIVKAVNVVQEYILDVLGTNHQLLYNVTQNSGSYVWGKRVVHAALTHKFSDIEQIKEVREAVLALPAMMQTLKMISSGVRTTPGTTFTFVLPVASIHKGIKSFLHDHASDNADLTIIQARLSLGQRLGGWQPYDAIDDEFSRNVQNKIIFLQENLSLDKAKLLDDIIIRRGPPRFDEPSFNLLNIVYLRGRASLDEIEHEIIAALGGLNHEQVDALQVELRQRSNPVVKAFIQELLSDHYISRVKFIANWLRMPSNLNSIGDFIEDSIRDIHGDVINIENVERITLFNVEGGFNGTTRLVYGVRVAMFLEKTGVHGKAYEFILKVPKILTDTLGPEFEGMSRIRQRKSEFGVPDSVRAVPRVGSLLKVTVPFGLSEEEKIIIHMMSEEYIEGEDFDLLILVETSKEKKREYAQKALFTAGLIYVLLEGKSPTDYNAGNLRIEENSGQFVLVDDGSSHRETSISELVGFLFKPYIGLLKESGTVINWDIFENMLSSVPAAANGSFRRDIEFFVKEFKQAAELLIAESFPLDASSQGTLREEIEKEVQAIGLGNFSSKGKISSAAIVLPALKHLPVTDYLRFFRGLILGNIRIIRAPPAWNFGAANHYDSRFIYIIIPQEKISSRVLAHEIYAVLHPEINHKNNPIKVNTKVARGSHASPTPKGASFATDNKVEVLKTQTVKAGFLQKFAQMAWLRKL
ncbi:MAG: hypothetical protein WCY34_06945, partial [Candidatus Omnitrophota bacterium]